MGEIVNQVWEKELFYKENLVLKYKIAFPQLIRSRFRYGAQKFNEYQYQKASQLKEYCETELLEDAKEAYEKQTVNGYPMRNYELLYEYEITYKQNGVLSLYTDEYIDKGGAHGLTTRDSQNWNLQNGKWIRLEDVFANKPYYIIDILKSINKQIEERKYQFFDNYCSLVQDHLKMKNFYMTGKGIVIFFNPYEIAPYATGIPEFLIK